MKNWFSNGLRLMTVYLASGWYDHQHFLVSKGLARYLVCPPALARASAIGIRRSSQSISPDFHIE